MSWKESRFVRPYISKLSPELVDLLDHVLHIDPDLVRRCVRVVCVCCAYVRLETCWTTR